MNIKNTEHVLAITVAHNYQNDPSPYTSEFDKNGKAHKKPGTLSIKNVLMLRQVSKGFLNSLENECSAILKRLQEVRDRINTAVLYNSPLLCRLVKKSSSGQQFIDQGRRWVNTFSARLDSHAFTEPGITKYIACIDRDIVEFINKDWSNTRKQIFEKAKENLRAGSIAGLKIIGIIIGIIILIKLMIKTLK